MPIWPFPPWENFKSCLLSPFPFGEGWGEASFLPPFSGRVGERLFPFLLPPLPPLTICFSVGCSSGSEFRKIFFLLFQYLSDRVSGPPAPSPFGEGCGEASFIYGKVGVPLRRTPSFPYSKSYHSSLESPLSKKPEDSTSVPPYS